MGGFSIQNPTIGGGTAYTDLLGNLLALLASDRGERAGTGAGLLSQFLDAELSAQDRGGLGIVDQLLLSGEVGSTMPLSQASREQRARYTRPPGTVLPTLTDILQGYVQGAIPQATVINLHPGNRALVRLPDGTIDIVPYDPDAQGVQTVQGRSGPFTISTPDIRNFQSQQEASLRRARPDLFPAAPTAEQTTAFQQQLAGMSPEERDAALRYVTAMGEHTQRKQQQFGQDLARLAQPRLLAEETLVNTLRGQTPDQQRATQQYISGGRAFQHGGSMDVNSGLPRTPYEKKQFLLQRRQRSLTDAPPEVAGPITMVDANGKNVGIAGEAGRNETITVTPQLAPDEQFRYEELSRNPNFAALPVETRVNMAQNPVPAARYLGAAVTPQQEASYLLGRGVGGDRRLSDTFRRSLALGRTPTPAELTMRDYSLLPPDLQDALRDIIGEQLWNQFAFELSAMSPTGVRSAPVVGGVRL